MSYQGLTIETYIPRLIVLQITDGKLPKKAVVIFSSQLVIPRPTFACIIFPEESACRERCAIESVVECTHLCDSLNISNSVRPEGGAFEELAR